MKKNTQGFFDANPKMLFIFGFVSGIALTMLIGGALPYVQDMGGDSTQGREVVQDEKEDEQEPEVEAVLAPVTDSDHIRGDIESASIVLIEYSDYECSYCGRHHPTLQSLMDTYGDDIVWVYRHFPLSFHEQAVPSALAAECAAEQGMFWEYTDELYEHQTALGDELYQELAQELGMDAESFSTCYSEERYLEKVQSDFDSGIAAGIEGTPGNFVNGVFVSGAQPASVFEGLIDQILAE